LIFFPLRRVTIVQQEPRREGSQPPRRLVRVVSAGEGNRLTLPRVKWETLEPPHQVFYGFPQVQV
jgi:hypothetical protein